MVRLGTLPNRVLAPAALCAVVALVISGCGSQPKVQTSAATSTAATRPGTGHTVYIYSSLPLSGPQRLASQQIQQGIQFALSRLSGGRAGAYRIRYRHTSDSARPARPRRRAAAAAGAGWNANAAVQNAEQAARNPQTVAFIGDLDSGATALSLPILNQAGIVQITPGSGYPGLTDNYSKQKITQPLEPAKYYPQSNRTLLRLIPNDIVQASAVLDVLAKAGCQHFSAWEFGGGVEATALLDAVIHTAPLYKMTYYQAPALPAAAKDYAAYVDALSHTGQIRCAVLTGHVTLAAVSLTMELRAQLPVGSTVVGTSGFCNTRWIRGLSSNVVAGLYCTTPARPVGEYLGGRDFSRRFERAHHRVPSAYAYYGYVAARMVIKAVSDLGRGQDPRVQVEGSLADDIASNELETYTFDSNGDVSYKEYGVDYFPLSAGAVKRHVLRHYRTVTPPYLLPSA